MSTKNPRGIQTDRLAQKSFSRFQIWLLGVDLRQGIKFGCFRFARYTLTIEKRGFPDADF